MRNREHYLSPAGNALAAYVMLMVWGAGLMAFFGLATLLAYVGGVLATIVAIAMVARGILIAAIWDGETLRLDVDKGRK